jgi:alpha-beta hydrolase superfamily lysophospholipase
VRSFDDYLDDLDCVFERARQREPKMPLFLFGHSMGGLIAALWCAARKPSLAGLMLSAPALRVANQLFPWLRRAASIASLLVPRLRLVRMGCGNLSRDPEVVRRFREDPLVFHDRFPVRTGAEILRAGEQALGRLSEICLPLLVLQGTADRVSAPDASRALVDAAESRDKQLHLYPGLYHDLLNEPEKAQVHSDLVEWIERRAK